MIRRLVRYILRATLVLVALILVLFLPVAYVEIICRGDKIDSDYIAVLPSEHHRAESRTFLTYPEWHIVHAYDDYAKVIQTGDPHDYAYFKGITGYWSSLCALSKKSAAHGGFNWETKQTIYTIGVSFSAELALKALYEETLGRIATWLRGDTHSQLDTLSAKQAADYAKFLQQIPWYRWDFERDISQLSKTKTNIFRDKERHFALGVEYGVKSSYANVINAAVANIGPDALTLRMIATGLSVDALESYEGVTVISHRPEGIEIETPRYRVLTHLLTEMALSGVNFVEIAGNDDIMLTATSGSTYNESLFSFSRQGYGDQRHLIALKVSSLANWLRQNNQSELKLEHIHDY